MFDALLRRGYRRIGTVFYRTACRECDACTPIRLVVARFRPSKSQRRTLRRNSEISVRVGESEVTHEKVALYEKYLASKHGRSASDEDGDRTTELTVMHYGYAHTLEMDYYMDERLVGVGIVDETNDSISSNYFYYDTDLLPQRLGIYSVLSEISLARLLGKRYYYLGFYLEELPKMSYKKFFRPNEIYQSGQWRRFFDA